MASRTFPCPVWGIARVWLPRRHPGVRPGQCCSPARKGIVPLQPLNPRPWASSAPAGATRSTWEGAPALPAEGCPPCPGESAWRKLYPAGPERVARTVWPPAWPRTDWARTSLWAPCPPPGRLPQEGSSARCPLRRRRSHPSPACWLGGGLAAWSPQPLQPLLLPLGSGQCLEPAWQARVKRQPRRSQRRSLGSSAQRGVHGPDCWGGLVTWGAPGGRTQLVGGTECHRPWGQI